MVKRFDYPQYGGVAQEGVLVSAPKDGIITMPSASARAAKVQTITPTVTNQAATTYSLRETITGQIVSVTSDASPTATEVCNLLRTAIRANAILNGLMTVSGTATLIATSRVAGLAGNFSFVDNASGQALAVVDTTAAAENSVIPFGRLLIQTPGSSRGVEMIDADLSTSIILKGISLYTEAAITTQGIGVTTVEGYAGDTPINVLRKGRAWVYVWEAVNEASPVHVYKATSRQGQFRASSDGSDTVSLVGTAGTYAGGLSFAGKTTGAGLVELDINLP